MSTHNINIKYIYSQYEKIYDIYRKKSGVIKYLRDDSREKLMRESNPNHYYYFIEYDDGSFDTYVSVNDFVPYKEHNYNREKINNDNIESSIIEYDYNNFTAGQRFNCKSNNKCGTVRYLRDDSHEKQMRKSDPNHYYYHVDFDDGSFETYIHGKYLEPI